VEGEILAQVVGRGPAAIAEVSRTPLSARWLTGSNQLAFEAAVELATRGEPVTPEAMAAEVDRVAGAERAAEVRQVVELAVEGYGGAAPAGRLSRLVDELAELRDDATGVPEASGLNLLDAAAIFAPLPPVEWLCRDLDIAPGAPTLFAGGGFSGKTVAGQAFGLGVLAGTSLWGTFSLRQGRVLHLDYEQGRHLTSLRYQRLARAMGIRPSELEGRLVVASLPGLYLDGNGADELERATEGFDLVLWDSFRAACPSTDENSSEARVPLDRLTRSSEKTGAVHLVIHHARKPTKDAPGGSRTSIRGSGALYDACGSVLVFSAEKGQPVVVAHEKARISGATHDDFGLWITDVELDGDPRAGLRVAVLDAPGQAEGGAADRFSELKRRVLELVRDEGPLAGGVNLVRARLGGRKDDVGAAVAELLREGAVVRGGSYREPTLALGNR
jgi:hypothetical protein